MADIQLVTFPDNIMYLVFVILCNIYLVAAATSDFVFNGEDSYIRFTHTNDQFSRGTFSFKLSTSNIDAPVPPRIRLQTSVAEIDCIYPESNPFGLTSQFQYDLLPEGPQCWPINEQPFERYASALKGQDLSNVTLIIDQYSGCISDLIINSIPEFCSKSIDAPNSSLQLYKVACGDCFIQASSTSLYVPITQPPPLLFEVPRTSIRSEPNATDVSNYGLSGLTTTSESEPDLKRRPETFNFQNNNNNNTVETYDTGDSHLWTLDETVLNATVHAVPLNPDASLDAFHSSPEPVNPLLFAPIDPTNFVDQKYPDKTNLTHEAVFNATYLSNKFESTNTTDTIPLDNLLSQGFIEATRENQKSLFEHEVITQRPPVLIEANQYNISTTSTPASPVLVDSQLDTHRLSTTTATATTPPPITAAATSCTPQTCPARSTCVSIIEPPFFSCICDDGYLAPNCTTAINDIDNAQYANETAEVDTRGRDCNSHLAETCHNNGRCVNSADPTGRYGFSCICNQGWMLPYCAARDPCVVEQDDTQYCSDHGTCYAIEIGFNLYQPTCSCDPEYTGSKCETPVELTLSVGSDRLTTTVHSVIVTEDYYSSSTQLSVATSKDLTDVKSAGSLSETITASNESSTTTTTTTATPETTSTATTTTRTTTEPITTTTETQTTITTAAITTATIATTETTSPTTLATTTSQSSHSGSSSSSNTGAIVGGIFGAILIVAALIGVFFAWRYIRRSRKLRGKYNPAKEEIANGAGFPVPLQPIDREERLI